MFYKKEDIDVIECKDYVIYCDRGLFVAYREDGTWYVSGLYHYDTLDDSKVLYVAEINHSLLEDIKSWES